MSNIITPEIYNKIFGGKNTKNPPFKSGDKIRQIWRLNNHDNLAKGREEYEFVGMKGNLMEIKTLNSYAAYNEDTLHPDVVEKNKKIGFKAEIGEINELHYMYADRFKIIKNKN